MTKPSTKVTATAEQPENATMSAAHTGVNPVTANPVTANPVTASAAHTGVNPVTASAVHTGVSTIFTEVHSATFQDLNDNVKAALAAAGDQASPLLKSVGEFLSNIKPIQADYVQGELATMSVTIPQADPYIMQAFRELFNIFGKEAALRIQMMNRAMKRAEELSENHSA